MTRPRSALGLFIDELITILKFNTRDLMNDLEDFISSNINKHIKYSYFIVARLVMMLFFLFMPIITTIFFLIRKVLIGLSQPFNNNNELQTNLFNLQKPN